MRQQKDVDWNNKKDLDKLKSKKRSNNSSRRQEKFEENRKNQQQHSNPDEKAFLEKQEKLQKMMNESMSEEMKIS